MRLTLHVGRVSSSGGGGEYTTMETMKMVIMAML